MKRRAIWFLLFLVVVLTVSCISGIGGGELRQTTTDIRLESLTDLYHFLTYTEKRYPLVSAHRGGPEPGFPENAIETFQHTQRRQPVIIECDVRMTRDSVLVLMHDESVGRTTNGTGKVHELDFDAIRKLRLKDPDGQTTPYRVPTLDQALRWGAGKVIFTIDVKRGVPYRNVIDAIRRNGAEAYSIIITYNADEAAEVHQLAPDLMISASIRSAADLLRLGDRNIPDNRLIAFVGTSEVGAEVYDLLHGHGILCILGTIGNLDRQAEARGDSTYIRFVERGADILATNRPVAAGRALRAYRQTHKLTSGYIR